MLIYFASDHAGVTLRARLLIHVQSLGHEVFDLGPCDGIKVDYPDFAKKLASKLQENALACGIAVCGSGIGISIALNRFSWIRAALVNHPDAAELARKHNNANVLALGERLIPANLAVQCVDRFLLTDFEGGRHVNRVKKLQKNGQNNI
jgi:ribose 5-phosphate isomerase B